MVHSTVCADTCQRTKRDYMISLRKSLHELEELERLFRSALQCYLDTLACLEHRGEEARPEEAEEHRARLRKIRKSISAEPSADALDQSRREVAAELERHGRQVSAYYRAKQQEIRKILEVLAEAAGSLTRRSELYTSQFRTIARELEETSRLDSLTAIRRRLTESVSRLISCVNSMRQEDDNSVTRLESQIRSFRQRLKQAETLASADPLTGMPNRREAERLISEAIQERQPLCVMLFDLDGFKAINDRYGHFVGDQVLRAFARRLASFYRASDVVCRWGGDEFLVVLRTDLRDALERAGSVSEQVRGAYSVQTPSGAVRVNVSASVGIAQHEPGESCEALFARADAFLYQNKGLGASRYGSSSLAGLTPKA